MHIVLDMIGYVCVLDTYGYVWICSASFWIRLDTVLDTSAFWICLDTFEYVWICVDTLGFGYACACPVLDTFGYVWIRAEGHQFRAGMQGARVRKDNGTSNWRDI